ncbi:MAG: aromatic amino acid transaminase, partial [Methylocella sp.]
MRSVKAAEHILVKEQTSKSYLGADGDVRFVELLAPIVFGEIGALGDLTGVQTPGGTGALRLAAELIARARPEACVWVGTPTWPNHGPIVREAGLRVRGHPYYDVLAGKIDFSRMMAALSEAEPGDILLLHGCCHNPTGADFSADQWRTLTDFIGDRGILPLIDLAYQGLGEGLGADAAATRAMIATLPDVIVAYSCDKNFGLYRERVGALWVKASDSTSLRAIRDNVLVIARSLWSMPPDHGAAVVRLILENATLAAIWRSELAEMRVRIVKLRTLLAAAEPRLGMIAGQYGMFATLPLTQGAIMKLRERNAIYMADSGRINIAGLREDTVRRFVAAVI